jgi:hypothetical protein
VNAIGSPSGNEQPNASRYLGGILGGRVPRFAGERDLDHPLLDRRAAVSQPCASVPGDRLAPQLDLGRRT